MKRYIISVLIIAVLVVIALSLIPGQQKSTMASSEEDAIAFYGVAKSGRIITACKEPLLSPCRQSNVTYENWYILRLPIDPVWVGYYTVDDGTGCTPYFHIYWNGYNSVRLDFCIDPNPSNCPCE
jgi:hypothetical protein